MYEVTRQRASTWSRIFMVAGGASLASLAFAGSLKDTVLFAWFPVDLTLAAVVSVLFFSTILGFKALIERKLTPGIWLVILVWLLFLPGILTAPMTAYAETKYAVLTTVTLLCAVSPFSLLNSVDGRRGFVAAILIFGSMVTLQTLILGSSPESALDTVTIEGGTTITTSQLICGAIVVATIWACGRIPTMVRVVVFVGCVVGVSAALLTGSRGPILATVLALAVALLFSPRLKTVRVKGIVIAGIALVATFGVSLRMNLSGAERIFDFVSGLGNTSSRIREVLWASAWHDLTRNPLGSGLGYFPRLGAFYPHNFFLEIGVELGLAALVVVSALIVWSLVRLIRQSTTLINSTILALFVFSLTNAMVSSDINGNRLLWITLFAGFAISQKPAKPRVDTGSRPDLPVHRRFSGRRGPSLRCHGSLNSYKS